jgi:hypothetical protein
VKMFFEMFQSRIDNLLHAKHLAAKQVFDIVNVPVCVSEPSIDSAREIVQAPIIDKNADKHGKCGEGRMARAATN